MANTVSLIKAVLPHGIVIGNFLPYTISVPGMDKIGISKSIGYKFVRGISQNLTDIIGDIFYRPSFIGEPDNG